MTTDPKLLTCPFCAKTATIYDGAHTRSPRYSVGCKSCGFQHSLKNDRKEAIDGWNDRPSPPENASPKGSDRSGDEAEIPNTAAGVAGPSIGDMLIDISEALFVSLYESGYYENGDTLDFIERLRILGFKIVRAE